MTKKLFNIAAVALLLGVSTTAQAQNSVEERNYPHTFITLQGGAQATLTHFNMGDLITPQVGLSVGRYFNSKVGARINVQGWQIKSGFRADRYPGLTADQKYKFNNLTADLDLLLNMSNIINPHRTSDKLDWILLIGWGVNRTWNYDEYNNISNNSKYVIAPEQCSNKEASFNGRIGTQFQWNLSRCFGLNLELAANGKNDIFNLKTNHHVDWQLQAMLGLNFRIGTKSKPRYVMRTVEVVDTIEVDETYTERVKKQRPVTKSEEKNIETTIFYKIGRSNADKAMGFDEAVSQVAELMKSSGDAKFTITGYADKRTGNKAINQRIAKKRAEDVASKLIKKHGIDRSRITVDSKGDTVQPYDENNKNRCVIITGEGSFKVTINETYEEPVQKVRKVKKTQTRQVEQPELVK